MNTCLTHLLDGHVLDESADDGSRLFFPEIHLLHIQRVGGRVLLHAHDLANAHVKTRHIQRSVAATGRLLLGC